MSVIYLVEQLATLTQETTSRQLQVSPITFTWEIMVLIGLVAFAITTLKKTNTNAPIKADIY